MESPPPDPPTDQPPLGRILVEPALLFGIALLVRVLTATSLGGGAPFGPDGTGAEAAVHLGGHLYPLHVRLIDLFGSGRALSVLAGALNCLLLWAWGRRRGLGGGGGWLAVTLPLLVYTSALSAGDAPALSFALGGALLSTTGRAGALLGGALALASVAVKPVVLPALVLLLPSPFALLGLLLVLPFAAPWIEPLTRPRPTGGLLGSWWASTEGRPPEGLVAVAGMVVAGLRALTAAPLWTGVVLAPLALLPLLRRADRTPLTGLGAGAALVGLFAVAALFGERLAPRYLTASLAALLPFIGLPLRGARRSIAAALPLLWASSALVTQLALERARQDPEASVPLTWALSLPNVDAEALFDECSTRGATAMRREAGELARSLPVGATVEVEHRVHGREGELTWPLRIQRPDLQIRVRQNGPADPPIPR